MAVSSPQVVEGEEMQREREGDEAREAGDSGEDEEKEEEGDAAEKTPAVEEAVEKTDAQAQVLLCVYTHTHTHTHTHTYAPLLSGICAFSACIVPCPAGQESRRRL